MQSASYTIQKFSEKFQQIATIRQLIEYTKTQKFDLEIDLIHRIPSILTWKPMDDSFSGEHNLLVYPRITIDGKIFAPPKMPLVELPKGILDYEKAFIKALKQAINTAEQVWS